MASIAFVVADSGSLDSDKEQPIYDRLHTTLGHTVTLVNDSDANSTDFSGYDAIVISPSISPSSSVSALKDDAVPIMTCVSYNYDEFSIGTGAGYLTAQTQINIVDDSHYITENESTGNLEVCSSSTHNHISGWSNDVNDLAQISGDAAKAVILEIDKDETLVDSSTAAERRVFFGLAVYAAIINLNADGWDLFDRSIGWCLYEDAGAEAGSADLSANLTVRNKSQSDLSANVTIRHKGQLDLSCNVTIQHKAQFDLSANVTIRNQGQYDLSASATIQNKGSYDLSANVTIQNKSQADLSANVTIRNKSQADLSANFTISGIQSGQADLSSNVTIQNKGSYDLSANVFIGTGLGGYIELADAIVHKIIVSSLTHNIVVDSQVHTIKVSSKPLME